METWHTLTKQAQLFRASLHFCQLWTFFFQSPHHLVMLLSWSPSCSSTWSPSCSSTNKTLVSMSGSHWSLCWSYFTTSYCHQSPGHIRSFNNHELEYFVLCQRGKQKCKFRFVWNICPHIDRHKYGQIHRLKDGPKIQTGGKFKARSCSYNMFLAYWYFGWVDELVLERSHRLHGSDHRCSAFCIHLCLLLHYDLSQTTATSSSSWTCPPRPTQQRRKSFAGSYRSTRRLSIVI